MTTRGPQIRIGTSGWHYRHWVGNFYPEKHKPAHMLAWYIQHFDTVELNNSFYRLPNVSALEAWRDSTPPDFCFALKGSRFITHNKKLKDPENALDNLLPRAEVLGKKLGPILFQLPPSWKKNLDRLEEFLTALPRRHRYAFEFREPSWLVADLYALLRRFNAAFCIYELAGYHSPIEVTADWVYVRLHGPGEKKYQGSYPEATLREWATKIRYWSHTCDVFVYFDNDQAGYAAANALTLKSLVTGQQEVHAA